MQVSAHTPYQPWTTDNGHARPSQWQSQQAAGFIAADQQHIDLELTTREGDTVSLSIDRKNFAAGASYRQAGGRENGGRSWQQADLTAAGLDQSFSMTVEGDLSAQERREIRAVLKTMKQMMHELVDGDLKGALKKTGKFGDLETVAHLDARMSYSRQIAVSAQRATTAVYDAKGAMAEPAPPIDDPSPWQPAVDKMNRFNRELARRIKQARVAMDRMMRSVDDMFARFRNQLDGDAHGDARGPSFIDRMRDDLWERVGGGSADEPDPVSTED